MGTKDVNAPHDLYTLYAPSWKKCRLVAMGSEEVKKAGSLLLPMLDANESEEYEDYKYRAVFFEGTTRTISGLIGMLFAKDVELTQPENEDFFEDITPNFETIQTFLKNLAKEVITVGRAGLFVDVDDGVAYTVMYKAEDIINWRTENIAGKEILTQIVLREELLTHKEFTTEKQEAYRVLYLKDGVYSQALYKKDSDKDKNFTLCKGYPLTPEKSGKTLDMIPFFFANATGMKATPERPPLIGLVNVNLAHYLNSADLEHGRHFTGLPTPWVAGFDLSGGNKLKIGSQVAWVSSKTDAKAGFLEFSGQGLLSLENGMKEKLDMMIILGARLLEAPRNVVESSENQTNRKQGENSILANIADSISEAATKAIMFNADWNRLNPNDYKISIRKDFVPREANPQMLTALISSIQGGLMSFEAWFYNLQNFGLMEQGTTVDQEKIRIAKYNADAFGNLADNMETQDTPNPPKENDEK